MAVLPNPDIKQVVKKMERDLSIRMEQTGFLSTELAAAVVAWDQVLDTTMKSALAAVLPVSMQSTVNFPVAARTRLLRMLLDKRAEKGS